MRFSVAAVGLAGFAVGRFLAAVTLGLGGLLPASVARADRKLSEEAALFRQLGPAVVTVFGEEGHGSGFLVDSSGVFLTNQHVVAKSSVLSVQLDDSLRVPALLLADDPTTDVAVVRVNPLFVRGRPVLWLARGEEDRPVEGERVFAIGSPLNQSRILTTGVVSKVEERGVITDVNLNPGNSGGPLLNLDGTVVAINTFLDAGASGPGVSGSIAISQAFDLLQRALDGLPEAPVPEASRLPSMPKDTFPLEALKACAMAEKWNERYYRVSDLADAGKFEVVLLTPPAEYRGQKQHELQISGHRRNREKRGGASATERYDPFEDLKIWGEMAGQYRPVVQIWAVPKTGQTAGSVAGNLFGAVLAGMAKTAYRGQYNYEFKADLSNLRLRSSDGNLVPEIQRNLFFRTLDFQSSTYAADYSGSDVARCGMFVYSPDIFGPQNGQWPDLELELVSIDNPDRPVLVRIPRATVERIWLDFEPYREEHEAAHQQLVVSE
jgi:hypothetical protein